MVDWHNYGYTIMAVNRSPRNPLVKLYKRYECFFGRRVPDVSVTVTEAMARHMREPPFSLKMPILTLHDRPAATFQLMTSQKERKKFLSELRETKDHADDIIAGKTRLVVSSTSWTPDEDFGILLEGLIKYAAGDPSDESSKGKATPLLVIITGKGPQKADFEKMMKNLKAGGHLPNVDITTAWLSTRDYASLLAAADLGVCLHRSSSGVDLPMKIVDMFGAGLPVAGYSAYESFDELVEEGVNGCGFETAEDLSVILRRLLSGKDTELKKLKQGAVKEGSRRWDDEWDPVIGKALGLVT